MKDEKKIKRSLPRKLFNFFLGLFFFSFFLILLFLGVAQTSSFRNYLKSELISVAGNSLDAELNIGKIDGTLISSIILRDLSLVSHKDTIFKSNKIELVFSPHKILFRKIYFRKIEISNLLANLSEDSTGVPLLSKIVKKDTASNKSAKQTEKEEDGSPFPFAIQIDQLNFVNINLVKQSARYLKSDKEYETINTDDLRIRDFNINAKAIANFENSTVNLIINNLAAKPNFKNFKLNRFEGKFTLTKKFAQVSNLKIKTENTDLELDVRLDSLNLLGGVELEDFNSYPLTLKLNAKEFDFDALTSFIEDTDLLKARLSLYLDAKGQFGNFDINQLDLNMDNSDIHLKGKLKNLHTPKKLFIDADIINSNIIYDDVKRLLPEVGLPDYYFIDLIGLNGHYKGEPTKFYANLSSNLNYGKLSIEGNLDLQKDLMEYDAKISTQGVNLESIIGMPTKLNSTARIKGKGTSPDEMDNTVIMNIKKSTLGNFSVDSTEFRAIGFDKKIKYILDGKIAGGKTNSKGELDFFNYNKPGFNIVLTSSGLNLGEILNDTLYNSSLNIDLNLTGSDFNLDKTNSKLYFSIEKSNFRNKFIPYTDLELKINSGDDGSRKVSLTSDIADLNLWGNFSTYKAIDIITAQSRNLTRLITSKIDELNPVKILTASDSLGNNSEKFTNPAYELTLNYDLKFKDFSLISLFLDLDKIEIEGSGKGIIENNKENFSLTTDIDLKSFSLVKKDPVYISNTNLSFSFSKSHSVRKFDDLFGTLSLKGKRFFSGQSVTNFTGDLTFNNGQTYFTLATDIGQFINADIEGKVNMEPDNQSINIDYLWLKYKETEWENNTDIKLISTKDSYRISDFYIKSKNTEMILDGIFFDDGRQEIIFSADSLNSKIVGTFLPDLNLNQLDFNAYADGTISGTVKNPLMKLDFAVDSLSFEEAGLGNIKGSFFYSAKRLKADLQLEENENQEIEKLNIAADIPIDLAFINVNERVINDKDLNIKLFANNFNLETFGNTLPLIFNQKGNLNSDINISGTFNDIKYSGFLSLSDSKFTARANYLDYAGNISVQFRGKKAVIEKFDLENIDITTNTGKLSGVGEIIFDGFGVKDIDFNLGGNLTVLSNKSRLANPNIYGSLFIESDGKLNYTYNKGKSYMKGKIIVRDANIIYANNQEQQEETRTDINYIFKVDSSKIDREEIRFQKLLAETQRLNKERQEKKSKIPELDFDFNFTIADQANMTFLISKAVNQKLDVTVSGGFEFSSKDGIKRAQGEFEILPGSTLDLIKIFDAQGKIRFESDITDPYLDVIATYENEYIPPSGDQSEEVAIKLSIQSPLSKISQNLSSNPDNIKIYRGAENIQNNIPDPQLDAGDAFTFILAGKFKDETTSGQLQLNQELQNLATNSILGTVFTNLANSMFGNLINNISVKSTGLDTKYSLSGKYKNIKYTIGARENDIGQNSFDSYDIRIDYFISPKFILRLEQKLPLVNTYGTADRIKELGVKYKFEF